MEKRKFPNGKAVAFERKNSPYQLVLILQSTSFNYKYIGILFQGKAGDDFRAERPNCGFLKLCLREWREVTFFIFKVNFLVLLQKSISFFLCCPAKPGLNSEQANQHNIL